MVGTEDAFSRGWVQKELNAAQIEEAESKEFRVIPIVIGDAQPGPELKGLSWIHVARAELSFELMLKLLHAMHPSGGTPQPRESRDVYISASWHPDDGISAKTVCKKLAGENFRLIGDSKSQQGFGSKSCCPVEHHSPFTFAYISQKIIDPQGNRGHKLPKRTALYNGEEHSFGND